MPRTKQPAVALELRRLGFRTPEDALNALLQDATKRRLSPTQVCERIVALERQERDHRNLARRTRVATLGTFKPLEQFDWNHPRSIDRDLYEWLTTLEFISRGHNGLLRGPSGVGKTMLAQNLGLIALQAGLRVRFVTLAAALADLLRQESLPALERRLRRYSAPELLIIDEIGYLPCDNRSADMLFHIVTTRHEVRSTVITTNLAFKQWSKIFPGAACVGALIDRFVQHCHVIDIDAESWRQKESIQVKDAQTRKAISKSSRTKRRA